MRPTRFLPAAAFVLVASSALAAGGTVYKWKDAKGGLHFSDTPPPPGATLVSGPARPAASQADSDQALQALQHDAAELAKGTPADDPPVHAAAEEKAAGLIAQECEQLRLTRATLERRRSGESSEILTDEERAALPASIAETDARIGSLCH